MAAASGAGAAVLGASGECTVSKKAFALRIDGQILDAMQRWADDDLRSLNAQIEWALRDALRKAGRVKMAGPPTTDLIADEAADPINTEPTNTEPTNTEPANSEKKE